MIGKGGELFDKYKKKLKEFNQNLEHIEFVETDSWYIRQIVMAGGENENYNKEES